MNVILIGMRGSGKSTIGEILAGKLGFNFIETDELIEKKVSQKIAVYVKKNGWQKFRDLEAEIIKNISRLDKTVISCGGGVVELAENITNLKQNGFLVYLKADIDMLYKRIGNDKNRPFLTNTNSMKKDLQIVLQKRKDLYERAADLILEVDNKSTKQVVTEIKNLLNSKQLI